MAKIKTYVGTDGKIHFTNSAGADSVLPFSGATKPISLGSKSVSLSGSTSTSTSISLSDTKTYYIAAITAITASSTTFANESRSVRSVSCTVNNNVASITISHDTYNSHAVNISVAVTVYGV